MHILFNVRNEVHFSDFIYLKWTYLLKNSESDLNFYALMTTVRGNKICPCLPDCLCLSVALYGIHYPHSFQWIFLIPCILVVDIMKMCMWIFDGARINFDRITAFRTKSCRQFLHCRVWGLCNPLPLQFSMDLFVLSFVMPP